MNELIEHIRAAVAQSATAEQKAVGAQACRTILAALDAEPGKPIVLAGTPQAQPLPRFTLDQALDLVIARLTTIANAQDARSVPNLPPPRDTVGVPASPRTGSRVPAPLVVPTNSTRQAKVEQPANAARETRPTMVARQTETNTARKP